VGRLGEESSILRISWYSLVNNPNKVVHGSHSGAIFGSFSISFSAHFRLFFRGTNEKGLKNETKNGVKNGYREHPVSKGIFRKMEQKCILLARHRAKKMENLPFLQKRG